MENKVRKWWTIQEAASYSGLPEQMLRMKMQAFHAGRQTGADLGDVVVGRTGRYSYYVFPSKFKRWLGEREVIMSDGRTDKEP